MVSWSYSSRQRISNRNSIHCLQEELQKLVRCEKLKWWRKSDLLRDNVVFAGRLFAGGALQIMRFATAIFLVLCVERGWLLILLICRRMVMTQRRVLTSFLSAIIIHRPTIQSRSLWRFICHERSRAGCSPRNHLRAACKRLCPLYGLGQESVRLMPLIRNNKHLQIAAPLSTKQQPYRANRQRRLPNNTKR